MELFSYKPIDAYIERHEQPQKKVELDKKRITSLCKFIYTDAESYKRHIVFAAFQSCCFYGEFVFSLN